MRMVRNGYALLRWRKNVRIKKPLGVLGSLAKESQRKATMGATTAVYELIWGEKPKRKKK